ncbi:MAG: pilus assembly protein PilM [Pseudomonadota bacterium]
MCFIRDRFKIAASRNDIIGLDIATTSIKFAVLGNSRSSCQLKHYSTEAISGFNEESIVKTSTELAALIKRMLAREKISTKKCIVALPDILVNSKWIRIDKSATENLEIAINLAVEEHIPYPLDAIYFDYQVFDIPDQNYLKVFLVACRKEHLDVRLEAIYKANLIPLFIEINSHALERAYIYLYPEYSKKPCALLVISDNQLTFLFLEAARQIHSYSERICNLIDKAMVLKKIHRCIHTFFLSYPDIKFKNLFLIGSDFLLLQDLEKAFGELYGLEAEIVEHNQLLSCSENLNVKVLEEIFPSLFLSVGLALRGFMS